MVVASPDEEINLQDLEHRVDLQLVEDEHCFREWQDELPELTDTEQQLLDKIKAGNRHLICYRPPLEQTVQLSVAGPLMFVGGFFLPPFTLASEKSIPLKMEDEGRVIRGQLEIIRLTEKFWFMVIESHGCAYSVEAGFSQMLNHMLVAPHPHQPRCALLSNGSSFLFLKVMYGEQCCYTNSKLFHLLDPGNALYDVLRIMKKIGQL